MVPVIDEYPRPIPRGAFLVIPALPGHVAAVQPAFDLFLQAATAGITPEEPLAGQGRRRVEIQVHRGQRTHGNPPNEHAFDEQHRTLGEMHPAW